MDCSTCAAVGSGPNSSASVGRLGPQRQQSVSVGEHVGHPVVPTEQPRAVANVHPSLGAQHHRVVLVSEVQLQAEAFGQRLGTERVEHALPVNPQFVGDAALDRHAGVVMLPLASVVPDPGLRGDIQRLRPQAELAHAWRVGERIAILFPVGMLFVARLAAEVEEHFDAVALDPIRLLLGVATGILNHDQEVQVRAAWLHAAAERGREIVRRRPLHRFGTRIVGLDPEPLRRDGWNAIPFGQLTVGRGSRRQRIDRHHGRPRVGRRLRGQRRAAGHEHGHHAYCQNSSWVHAGRVTVSLIWAGSVLTWQGPPATHRLSMCDSWVSDGWFHGPRLMGGAHSVIVTVRT